MLLAIDTATRMMSLALHDGRQIIYEHTWHTPNNHTVELTPAIHTALQVNQIRPTNLTSIAISQGPGSFTGLRIGMGVAKGLVTALDIPLIAVPTLDITAAAIPPYAGPLISVLQAGRGRVCAQTYTWLAGNWTPAGQPEIVTWEDLLARVTQPTLLAGEINDRGHALLQSTEQPLTLVPAAYHVRRAGFLADLAWARLRAGHTDNPAAVTPIYLHQPGVAQP